MICTYEWDAERREYHGECRADDGTDCATASAPTLQELRVEMDKSIGFYLEVAEMHGREAKLTLPVPAYAT